MKTLLTSPDQARATDDFDNALTFLARPKAGSLAQAVEIASTLEVGFRSGMDVDRAKQQDLGRRAGREGLRDRLSTPDRGDLILAQSNVLPKECFQVRIRLRKAGQGGRSHQDQQRGSRQITSGTPDHGYSRLRPPGYIQP